jgi:transposase
MSKFVDCERNQAFLLPPDLRDWIPEDDLAHFVIEAVERVEMSTFKVNHRGTGSAQYHPRMMLALLIYCYANGIFSSRRIERATHRDIGVRFVAANVHPDHDTIAAFRRENLTAKGREFPAGSTAGQGVEACQGGACQRRWQQVRGLCQQAPIGDL